MRSVLKNSQGQVIVEYILMLALVVFMVGAMSTVFRKSIRGLWGRFTTDTCAACPTCAPPCNGAH